MSDIFGKIFGKDKHQNQQSKEKEKCSSPSADKSATSLTASTSAKTSDFCMYKAANIVILFILSAKYTCDFSINLSLLSGKRNASMRFVGY